MARHRHTGYEVLRSEIKCGPLDRELENGS